MKRDFNNQNFCIRSVKISLILEALRRTGFALEEMAMVGDQIFTDRLAAGLYGIPCLYTMPRGGDHQKGVQFKRKFEPFWIARYYQKGGRLYE